MCGFLMCSQMSGKVCSSLALGVNAKAPRPSSTAVCVNLCTGEVTDGLLGLIEVRLHQPWLLNPHACPHYFPPPHSTHLIRLRAAHACVFFCSSRVGVCAHVWLRGLCVASASVNVEIRRQTSQLRLSIISATSSGILFSLRWGVDPQTKSAGAAFPWVRGCSVCWRRHHSVEKCQSCYLLEFFMSSVVVPGMWPCFPILPVRRMSWNWGRARCFWFWNAARTAGSRAPPCTPARSGCSLETTWAPSAGPPC